MHYLYHYVKMVQLGDRRNRKLEMRVREMERRSDEATSMETMMETLGRIQRSIEEDPDRCKAEITTFSKLLWEGYLR
jgi:hypothetical protein